MRKSIAILVGMLLVTSANAAVYTLTFEGLQNQEPILSYYNGGLGGLGSGPGPAWGVEFANTLALIDEDAPGMGGTGNFANEPSPSTAAYFSSGVPTANVPAGFDTGFATWYSNVGHQGDVYIWSGLNGSGSLLGQFHMVALSSDMNGGDPNGTFNRWQLGGTTFSGTAHSVTFGGTANYMVYDDMTFGSSTPEPTSLALLAVGVLALARRR